MYRLIAATALLCFALPTIAFAQVNSAIGGTVQDSSQALIPGVSIKATNTQTGVVTTTISNESGAYNFAALIPGTYSVTASLPGFRSKTFSDVQLSAAAPLRLNFTLEVGAVSTQVDVTVAPDTLLTQSGASIGEVLTESRVQNLPVVGNNVLDLGSDPAGLQGKHGWRGLRHVCRCGSKHAQHSSRRNKRERWPFQ